VGEVGQAISSPATRRWQASRLSVRPAVLAAAAIPILLAPQSQVPATPSAPCHSGLKYKRCRRRLSPARVDRVPMSCLISSQTAHIINL
jgi:hypothetical protein